MKTITSITRLIGKRQHKNMFDLAEDILIECENNGVTSTSRGTPITEKVIINVIKSNQKLSPTDVRKR